MARISLSQNLAPIWKKQKFHSDKERNLYYSTGMPVLNPRYLIDRNNGVPAYMQIVEQVKESLHTGQLQVGDYLPSVSEVVRSSVINANTVMKAYRELEYAGIAKPLQGIGTVITSLPPSADPQALEIYQSKFEALVSEARDGGIAWEALEHLIKKIIRQLRESEEASGGHNR